MELLDLEQIDYWSQWPERYPTWMSNMQKQYHKIVYDIVKQKGGFVRSWYITNKGRMKFRCGTCSHTWETRPACIKAGSWCGKCAGMLPLSIEEMQELAISRGGKCISTEYISSKSKLVWECAEGHRWTAVPTSIKSHGTWCPLCAKFPKLTIEDLQVTAASRGGWCLENRCLGVMVKHRWKCANLSHKAWLAKPNSLRNGTWCPECSVSFPPSLEKIRAVATERGGFLLSNKYVSHKAKLEWKCEKGHIWQTSWTTVQSGHWCPKCKHSHGERLCYSIISKFCQKITTQFSLPQFPKRHYDFCFEYGSKYYLLEFDGEQHFEEIPFFHRNPGCFERKRDIDRLKTQTALSSGYNLIRIDYTQIDSIEDHIRAALESDSQCYLSNWILYSWLFQAPSQEATFILKDSESAQALAPLTFEIAPDIIEESGKNDDVTTLHVQPLAMTTTNTQPSGILIFDIQSN
jgi:hypothetical protein